MTQSVPSAARRLEGRLFVDQGVLCFVLNVDAETQTARVSLQQDGQRLVIEMPVSAVERHLSVQPHLQLDSLNTETGEARLSETDEGWYFKTRDGREGPFPSRARAHSAFKKFMLDVQSTDAPREPRRANG